MQMSDTREIQADPAIVYAALQDPKVLKTCIAGATEVTGTPQDGYTATVVQKVGPVRATFKGHVTMSDMVENRSMKLAGEGKGGVAGFAKGGADVTLAPGTDGGTLLSYNVESKVGGKLAQLGNRLIDGFAKKMADQFFARLKDELEGPKNNADPANS
ncbi:carbon monoxide dehydrogenase subunit G (plasmid) [Pseudohalocynthiibacter aestuariivivens]|nr:carbon monoxide dehydrogenase subunit G [Pseudohalocynthiibacter aestuariivivens]QIE48096.1 carbon monoxide dehydrogenase subunit G [Pseudohalocynthiibacter aestuariivivens]